jgi:hypothetical protein
MGGAGIHSALLKGRICWLSSGRDAGATGTVMRGLRSHFPSFDCSVTIQAPKVLIGPGADRSTWRFEGVPMLRKLGSLLALAFLFVSLLSCGSGHDSDEYYVFVAANLQVPYWQTAGAGFSRAAGQMKVRTDFLGPNTYDPKAEREALDRAVQQKATGILLAVTDPALLKDSIDKAIAAGIPVVTIDFDAPASKRLFFIGTNNYQVGQTGG